MNRYERQQILPQVGKSGQAKLSGATVLVVGAGGLGSPVLQYLCSAGVGTLVIVDPDTVELTNLHRQPLYNENLVGLTKVDAAKKVLEALNADIQVIPHVATLNPDNAHLLVGQADIALDCADNYAVSYMLSDACSQLGKPLISASALALSGYVGGFCASAPSLRAVFPDIPNNMATCATAGILGPVVAMMGILQAQMSIGVLLHLSPSPLGQMISIDLEKYSFSSFRFDNAEEPKSALFHFISASSLNSEDVIIDLRGEDEAPDPVHPDALRMSVDMFCDGRFTPAAGKRTVFACRSGLRAWNAAKNLRNYWDGDIALIALASVGLK
ncbi:HesA/MoeB/ThiF family protein [Xenorhabdus szentirmaii]|uniref:Thiamine biosynthesis protein ThiF n=1 Tax=Xenorhabdus szentirmaii DSM 16338 TaxID=1427518 RepID=W1J0K4_9GAMM|nr:MULTISPECIES: HesA/MoeB/ThiF family protein [Xenorhabdus]MBD2781677.1 HesA/MoeB/ThiF family protein [Xenorhabdus sp. 38]MBD2790888.1 HesA/MoeB/ThiF family protein [Xenorhabdus sp. CUL]MBD2804420.1 HesA/MoeB/ThiF family protein [Xenorhabdus sp. ZM]MBD2819932.1 HesA/MoeB/ThiF family protein [Xenorhabdus sp. 42]MBD2825457.1 HesA/MoeB/ThiF family protein [Xenorhabdus sp. 5]